MSDRAAWIVIHADQNGEPGQILGWYSVPKGRTENVLIEIIAIHATRTMHVLLYENAGKPGVFETGIDLPIRQNGTTVATQFNQIVE